MPEKTCPPHRFETKMDGWMKYYRCQFCGESLDVLLSDKEIERRLNEYERLAIGIDAFLSDATLLPVFSHAPEALSNFIIGWVKSFQAILSGGKDET